MRSPWLILSLLLTLSISIGSRLQFWHQNWSGARNQSASVLNMLVGDSRKMFANHFFAKADAYFHSGYYPSIFDARKNEEESHLTAKEGDHKDEEKQHVHDENCTHEKEEDEHIHDENCKHETTSSEGGFLGAPKDWIDQFSRNFFPSQHSHLEKGDERQMLPWFRLSAELDPQQVETYTIASYWLRTRLGKVDEAEQFLREGMRANPDSYEIYFELGRIYNENRNNPTVARNLWEVALRKWDSHARKIQSANSTAQTNDVVHQGIVGQLARLEEAQGDLPKAIYYLQLLKKTSPSAEEIQKQIGELQVRLKK